MVLKFFTTFIISRFDWFRFLVVNNNYQRQNFVTDPMITDKKFYALFEKK